MIKSLQSEFNRLDKEYSKLERQIYWETDETEKSKKQKQLNLLFEKLNELAIKIENINK